MANPLDTFLQTIVHRLQLLVEKFYKCTLNVKIDVTITPKSNNLLHVVLHTHKYDLNKKSVDDGLALVKIMMGTDVLVSYEVN